MNNSLNISQNTNVLTQVIQLYGSLDYLYDFLLLNPGLLPTSLISAPSIIFYDKSVIKTTLKTNSFVVNSTTNQFNYLGIYNQSLMDIVTRYYGSLDYLFQFLSINQQILHITEPAEGNIYNIISNSSANVNNFNKLSSVFATYIQKLETGKSFDVSFDSSFD